MACPPELREIRETLRTNIQVFLMYTKKQYILFATDTID